MPGSIQNKGVTATMKHKKTNPINPVTKKLNAFMTGMENSDMRQVVANLQAVIEYKEEELRIYRKKYKEETGKERYIAPR